MTTLREIPLTGLPMAGLEPSIGAVRYTRLRAETARFKDVVGARAIWNVSSTATGGGVAELQRMAAYAAGMGLDVRWAVIGADPEFFAITKRLHNQIHGVIGAAGPVDAAGRRHYQNVLATNAAELLQLLRPGDVALLHDPQTAGLAEALTAAGVLVIWRCHIGLDWANDVTQAAWDFLRGFLEPARGYIFSRRQYVPAWMPTARTWIIAPSIDPTSAKNSQLDPATVRAILATIGVLRADPPQVHGQFVRSDGSSGDVTRAGVVAGGNPPGPDDPVVVQVSRWDRLKDPVGVMRGFAEHVAPGGPGYLMLVGPAVSGVTDDPEGAAVLAECLEQWHQLPGLARSRVLLVTLPMDDIDENAAMVNAIQRYASVVVQKSLAEGFGLTVAEGMWKRRPVVGSAVGGILDQITDGTGVLLHDPADLAAFGAQVRRLLDHPEEANRIGAAGHDRVQRHYLGDRELLQLADCVETVAGR